MVRLGGWLAGVGVQPPQSFLNPSNLDGLRKERKRGFGDACVGEGDGLLCGACDGVWGGGACS